MKLNMIQKSMKLFFDFGILVCYVGGVLANHCLYLDRLSHLHICIRLQQALRWEGAETILEWKENNKINRYRCRYIIYFIIIILDSHSIVF